MQKFTVALLIYNQQKLETTQRSSTSQKLVNK